MILVSFESLRNKAIQQGYFMKSFDIALLNIRYTDLRNFGKSHFSIDVNGDVPKIFKINITCCSNIVALESMHRLD